MNGHKTRIEATIVADSVNAAGRRVTTFLLVYPRFLHSELLTHRAFGRNAASSRAIPVATMLRNVWNNPAIPYRWGRMKKGMQDGGPLPNSTTAACKALWLLARYPVMFAVWLLVKIGLHKQVANRLLEPWSHMTVVVTATEWKNFYRLRLHKDAQPEFRILAEKMLWEHVNSKPIKLGEDGWHLPFWRDEDDGINNCTQVGVAVKRCTARCARTSYVNFYGKDSVEDDYRLHDDLMKNGHWSPFEHCCQASPEDRFFGHLRGFIPYRKFFSGENRDDGTPFDADALWAELHYEEFK